MPARIISKTPPIAAEQRRQTEQRLRMALAEDYRSFLLARNGGQPTHTWC